MKMVFEFRFPDVGEGIHEGELVKWLVNEGDFIKEDQAIAKIETDKAIVEIPSPKSGKVLKLHFKEGDTIKVGETLVTIGEEGERVSKTSERKTYTGICFFAGRSILYYSGPNQC